MPPSASDNLAQFAEEVRQFLRQGAGLPLQRGYRSHKLAGGIAGPLIARYRCKEKGGGLLAAPALILALLSLALAP